MKNRLTTFALFAITIFVFNCTKPGSNSNNSKIIPANDSNFYYCGRFDFSNPNAPAFAYTGSSIQFRFEGSVCSILLKNKSNAKSEARLEYKNYYTITIDNKTKLFSVSNSDTKINLKGLSKGIHEISIFKRTEAFVGYGIFEGIEIEKDKNILPSLKRNSRKMEFIGNSITCGYGNEGANKDCKFSPETENGHMAYGAIAARKLNADYMAVAYSGKGMYRNYDGTTSNTMSLIYDRIFPDSTLSPKFNFSNWTPDMIVINLGTNDFVKGVPDSITFVNTYSNFLKRLRNYYPDAYILCVNGPMMNDNYPPNTNSHTKLKNYIRASIQKLTILGDIKISTFFPTPQGEGDYGCDWHPNIQRHEKMADELIKEIKFAMKW